jgi:hypothetical protein
MSYLRVFGLTRKTYTIVKGFVQGDFRHPRSNQGFDSESIMQDEKLGISMPSVKPKTMVGTTKPSRPIHSGQTSKPFWSKGKPKCKKGFRYDFKRKLCVKIK